MSLIFKLKVNWTKKKKNCKFNTSFYFLRMYVVNISNRDSKIKSLSDDFYRKLFLKSPGSLWKRSRITFIRAVYYIPHNVLPFYKLNSFKFYRRKITIEVRYLWLKRDK